MIEISNDGVLYGSSSSTDGGYYTISFEDNKLNYHEKAISKGDPKTQITTYYLGDETVGKDEFDAYMKEYSLKKQVEWINYCK